MASSVQPDTRPLVGVAKMISCVGLVGVVGVLDFLTGTEIGFSIFYLIPVAIGTWQLGVRAGVFVSVCSALAWWIDDALLGERVYSHAVIPAWNAAMRFGVFVMMSVMLARLEQLAMRLGASGFKVVTAADAVTGFTAAVRERPDAVVLDLGLPAGDGLGVLARVRSHPKLSQVPVIVLSARPAATERNRAMKAGASAYLEKPADNRRLIASVQAAIGGLPTGE
jgi:CheY-like chemotaxis protein